MPHWPCDPLNAEVVMRQVEHNLHHLPCLPPIVTARFRVLLPGRAGATVSSRSKDPALIISITSFEFQGHEPITAVAYRFFRTDRSDGRHMGDFFVDEVKVARDVLRLAQPRQSDPVMRTAEQRLLQRIATAATRDSWGCPEAPGPGHKRWCVCYLRPYRCSVWISQLWPPNPSSRRSRRNPAPDGPEPVHPHRQDWTAGKRGRVAMTEITVSTIGLVCHAPR